MCIGSGINAGPPTPRSPSVKKEAQDREERKKKRPRPVERLVVENRAYSDAF